VAHKLFPRKTANITQINGHTLFIFFQILMRCWKAPLKGYQVHIIESVFNEGRLGV